MLELMTVSAYLISSENTSVILISPRPPRGRRREEGVVCIRNEAASEDVRSKLRNFLDFELEIIDKWTIQLAGAISEHFTSNIGAISES